MGFSFHSPDHHHLSFLARPSGAEYLWRSDYDRYRGAIGRFMEAAAKETWPAEKRSQRLGYVPALSCYHKCCDYDVGGTSEEAPHAV